jgi:parafibromin
LHAQDFTTIRKQAELFIGRKRPAPGAHPTAPPPSTTNPALVSLRGGKPASTGRRLEPIVLLSPSASSLLRMSNIKQFLEGGIYVPPDSTSIGTNILHTQRPMRTVDPQRPLRFILVDTPDQFKPDYWQRVVAVFTTGQTWQFKSYKWTNATELFSHALGIYVGWAGEQVPDTVKGWGRMVKCVQIEKWNASQGEKGRWRDREVVESIWTAIEESMRARGWAHSVPGR